MWKPASSTPVKRPSRSTTYAFCCGTTIAVLKNSTITKIAATNITKSKPVIQTSSDRPPKAVLRRHGRDFDTQDLDPPRLDRGRHVGGEPLLELRRETRGRPQPSGDELFLQRVPRQLLEAALVVRDLVAGAL